MTDNRVEVALPSDENYVCGLLVTAASMATYMPKDVTLSINVLDGGIRDDTFAAFAERVRRLHLLTEFRRLRINEADFTEFPSWSGNKMAYARLLLPQLLPEVDHVIYCDTDYIWLINIIELWKQRDDNVILQSVRDGCEDTILREQKWFAEHRLPFNFQTYFCTGLLMLNLSLMREECTISRAFTFLLQNPDVKMADQTTLNFLLCSRVRLLPTTWQFFSRNVGKNDLAHGCAIHFAGEVPWRKLGLWINTITDTMLIWHRFNAHLHDISTWASLRRWYGAGEIVRRRIVFYVAGTPVLRNLFFAFLRMSGRGVYVNHFKTWCRSVQWKGIDIS